MRVRRHLTVVAHTAALQKPLQMASSISKQPPMNPPPLWGLIRARDGRHAAIGYRSGHDDLPEPLCMLWEPAALARLAQQARAGRNGLRNTLPQVDLLLPTPPDGVLDNANTPPERERLMRRREPASEKR